MIQSKSKKSSEMAALMGEVDAQMASMRKSFVPGEKMRGIVLSTGGQFVVLDINSKIQGVVDKTAFGDIPIPQVGEEIDAYFVEILDGTAKLVMSSGLSTGSGVANEVISQAFIAKLPVDGKIEKEIPGGFEVNIAGVRAFCPYSQTPRHVKPAEGETSPIVGKSYPFLVIDCKERECVVSNRAFVEKEKAEKRGALRAELRPGVLRDGVVSKLMPFGAFVDIGGVEGLIPLRELSWDRNAKIEDIVSEGLSVRVEVLEVHWDDMAPPEERKDKLTFSLRSTSVDPFTEYAQEFAAGNFVTGKVVKLMPFGAFVQLEPGVEGLIPIARLGSGRRINHPREVLNEGDMLDLKIETIDVDTKKISLSIVDKRVLELAPGEIAVGAEMRGIVESIQAFGVFVRLSEEKTGLLHISESQTDKGGNPVLKLEQKFPHGSEIRVVVKSMDGDRISLALPGANQAATDEENESATIAELLRKNNARTGSAASISSIGSLLDDLLK